MASKTGSELSTKELEELLDAVDLTMDRLKTLYEQYFLGIQKQAPSFIHNDVERKLRDLTQVNIRNTGLRYRLATLQQKFGSYNSYWRRTLRQIENGTYARNLAKLGRDAARTGSDIPEEILAKMPKRMREQVLKDRDAAIAIAKRRNQLEAVESGIAPDAALDADDTTAPFATTEPKREAKTSTGAHLLADDDGDLDFDSLFAAFADDDAPKLDKPAPKPEPKPERKEPTTPGMSLRTPAATTQPTTAIPRVAPVGAGASPTSQLPRVADPNAPTTAIPKVPPPAPTGGMPRVPPPAPPGMPRVPPPAPTGAMPRVPAPGPTGSVPKIPTPGSTPPVPRPATPAATPPPARPAGPPAAKPAAAAGSLRPPPGMTEADVNALHAKYVKAKEAVGEKVDASSREKLLRTINQTAPKIMEQYKASGVDFSVVVKDNQVVIKAKPKT